MFFRNDATKIILIFVFGAIVGAGAVFLFGRGVLHDAVGRAESLEKRARILEAGLSGIEEDFSELEGQVGGFVTGISDLGELEQRTIKANQRVGEIGTGISGDVGELERQIAQSSSRFERIDLIIERLETEARSCGCGSVP